MPAKLKPAKLSTKRLSGLALLAAAGLSWLCFVDPLLSNWGAWAEERGKALPGDNWVKIPQTVRTRAIRIQAQPDAIWPWLLQLGSGRGGFYTFELIERLRSLNHQAGHQLEPKLQQLQLGDQIALAQNIKLQVLDIQAEKSLVLGSPDPEPHAWSWAFVIEPESAYSSRLLVRERYGRVNSRGLYLLHRLVLLIDNLMSWKMLKGIQARVHSHSDLSPVDKNQIQA